MPDSEFHEADDAFRAAEDRLKDKFQKAIKDATGLDPTFDLTDMGQGAVTAHELFSSYMDVGFTMAQSIYLTGCCMTGNPGIAPMT
jgi:hypothetical protein